MQKREYVSILEDVRRSVGRIGLNWQLQPGQLVEPSEQELVASSVKLWLTVIGDTIGWNVFDFRTICTWVTALRDTGIVAANEFFKEIDSALLHSRHLGDFRSRTRTRCVGELKALLAPFDWCIKEWFYELDERKAARHLKKLRTCLLFLSHLTVKDDSSTEKSYKKYYDNLERLANFVTLPSPAMQSWLARQNLPSPWQFKCSHGSGSVAEQQRKGNRLVSPSEYDKYFLMNTKMLHRYCRLCGVRPPWWRLNLNPCRWTRLSDQPKGLGERRIIGMEPTAKQYVQHSLYRCMDFRVTKLASHCNLHDQLRNAEAARIGSEWGEFACVDLSSASDSVRWNFVVSLLKERPDWVAALALARTRFTLRPDGSVVENYHFAGMGSACTFNVECIVFSAIIVEAYRILGISEHAPYWVYGDDLVILAVAYDLVLELLEYYGFVPNKEKSFGPGDINFREACGGHWFCGYDVAPIRLGRKFSLLSKLDVLDHLTDLANRAFGLFPTLRQICIRTLKDTFGDYVPYTHDHAVGGRILTYDDIFSMPSCTDKSLQEVVYPVLSRIRRPNQLLNSTKTVRVGHCNIPPEDKLLTLQKDVWDLRLAGDFGFWKWLTNRSDDYPLHMINLPNGIRLPVTDVSQPTTLEYQPSNDQMGFISLPTYLVDDYPGLSRVRPETLASVKDRIVHLG